MEILLFAKATMPRSILDESHIHPAIREQIARHEEGIVRQVQEAVARHAIVVVGMAGNPFPAKARKALNAAGLVHEYMEFGSYFSQWRQRNALKLWTGWPTFPMVFIKGTLIGGAKDLTDLLQSGELAKMLA